MESCRPFALIGAKGFDDEDDDDDDKEFSGLRCRTVTGYHLYDKSVCEISALVNCKSN